MKTKFFPNILLINNKILLLAFSILLIQKNTFAQWSNGNPRKPVYLLTSNEQTLLAQQLHDYINADVLTDHCDMRATAGGDIHSDFDFLPFHRAYIQDFEDYLVLKGYHQFVPLPTWKPVNAPPTAFTNLDPSCYNAICMASNNCNDPLNSWSINIPLPYYLTVHNNPGLYNDLCDFPLNPMSLPATADCCPEGLSRVIEGDHSQTLKIYNGGYDANYHNSVHTAIGGPFGTMMSPSYPAFWLWHSYVDNTWRVWEESCSNSNISNHDLFMKDHPNSVMSERDLGLEPSIYNGNQYLSYDIWCRNQPDGYSNATHQNPINDGNSTTHVYIRIRNRGKLTSQGTEQLKLYWAKAGTSLSWPNSWNGTQTITGSKTVKLGDQLGTITIPQIEPMDQEILHFQWTSSMIPDPSDYSSYNSQQHHFCMLARIEDPNGNDIMYNEQTTGIWNLGQNVKNNNNIIWKNMSIIDQKPDFNDPNNPDQEVNNSANFYVGNMHPQATQTIFDFIFEVIESRSGNSIIQDADATIDLEQSVWDIWENGGFMGENVEIVDEENRKIRIVGNPAKLKNLDFDPDFLATINLGFNFLTEEFPFENEYNYNVRQVMYSEGNEITVGGEGFKIYPPIRSGFLADAGLDHKISIGDSTELRAADIGENAIYIWYDESGEQIHEGKNVFVSPTGEHEYKLEVIADEDGIKDYDKVTVGIRESQILSVSPNPATDQIDIHYELENVTSGYFLILMPYGGSYQYPIDINLSDINIDLSNYQPGLYYISLVCDGVSVDSENLIIN